MMARAANLHQYTSAGEEGPGQADATPFPRYQLRGAGVLKDSKRLKDSLACRTFRTSQS